MQSVCCWAMWREHDRLQDVDSPPYIYIQLEFSHLNTTILYIPFPAIGMKKMGRNGSKPSYLSPYLYSQMYTCNGNQHIHILLLLGKMRTVHIRIWEQNRGQQHIQHTEVSSGRNQPPTNRPKTNLASHPSYAFRNFHTREMAELLLSQDIYMQFCHNDIDCSEIGQFIVIRMNKVCVEECCCYCSGRCFMPVECGHSRNANPPHTITLTMNRYFNNDSNMSCYCVKCQLWKVDAA